MTTLAASPPTTADRLHGLRRWNAGLSVLHLTQALAILALSSSFSLPVTSSFLRMDSATNKLTAVPDGPLPGADRAAGRP